MPLNN